MVRCAASRPDRAENCAAELLEAGCTALMSFGIGGGLSPEISAGQVVVADRVVLPGGREVMTDESWRERLLAALRPKANIVVGPVVGSETIVADPEEKQKIYRQTGAVVVDMESHRVAKVAAAVDVPFLVIRAVSDTSVQGIPKSAIGAINENGTPRYGKVISGLFRQPGDLPKLIRLSKDTDRALASLRGVVLTAGALFRFN